MRKREFHGRARSVSRLTLPFLLAMTLAGGGILEPPASAAATVATGRWSGVVVDAAGQPVEGAQVAIYQSPRAGSPFAGYGFSELIRQASTDSKGRFDCSIPRVSSLLVARKAGCGPAWVQLWNPREDVTDQKVDLPKVSSIAGKVVDENGQPVAGAEVRMAAGYQERQGEGGTVYNFISGQIARELFAARTDSGGAFKLKGFPDGTAVNLFVTSRGKVLRPEQRDHIGPDTMLCRSGDSDVVLVMDPAGTIAGKVVAKETGEALKGAGIIVQGLQSGTWQNPWAFVPVPTDAEGRFKIEDLAPGDYSLATRFGTNDLPAWVAELAQVKVEPGEPKEEITIAATRGGILEVLVSGLNAADVQPQTIVNASGSNFHEGKPVGSDGRIAFRLPEGAFKVMAFRGNTRSEPADASVEAGKTNRVEIELPEKPRISGRVRDPSGAAVAGLALTIFPDYRAGAGEIKTDQDGSFSFEWSPERYGGSEEAFCLLARDVERNLATAVEIDESTTTLEVKLENGLAVSGRVEDEGGKALTNATLQLYLWTGNMGSQFERKPYRVAVDGKFEIKGLPPDRRFSAQATAPGYGSGNQQIQDDAGSGERRLELPPFVLKVADRKLAGTVLDAEERPVAGATVHIYGEGQPSVSVRSEKDGRFAFAGVCEGSVQVSASARNAFGNARGEAGETNLVVRLHPSGGFARTETPRLAPLVGKPLPDFTGIQIDAASVPAGKPLLVCLFDFEQRSSRRFLKLMAERHESLARAGIALVGIQTAPVSEESFAGWKTDNPMPFPVGRLLERDDKTRWASDLELLPCLILTDKDRKVTQGHFSLDDLDARLKETVANPD